MEAADIKADNRTCEVILCSKSTLEASIVSKRTGDKSRHNRQAKQRAKLRARVRELRASLSARPAAKKKQQA